MNQRLAEILVDLQAESEQLDALVAPLDDAGWHLATPAQGWDIRYQIAHLTWTDEAMVTAATDQQAWDRMVQELLEDLTGFVDKAAARGASAPTTDVLARWRSSRAAVARALAARPDGARIPWFGPPMSPTTMATARFMETWAHGRDVADALGETLPFDDRVRHVVHLGVRTRDFAFRTHSLEPPQEQFYVALTLPSGHEVSYGSSDVAQSVRGSAYDFALLVTQRGNLSDLDVTAEGADAQRWLSIAQAFAGPPGAGRGPQ